MKSSEIIASVREGVLHTLGRKQPPPASIPDQLALPNTSGDHETVHRPHPLPIQRTAPTLWQAHRYLSTVSRQSPSRRLRENARSSSDAGLSLPLGLPREQIALRGGIILTSPLHNANYPEQPRKNAENQYS